MSPLEGALPLNRALSFTQPGVSDDANPTVRIGKMPDVLAAAGVEKEHAQNNTVRASVVDPLSVVHALMLDITAAVFTVQLKMVVVQGAVAAHVPPTESAASTDINPAAADPSPVLEAPISDALNVTTEITEQPDLSSEPDAERAVAESPPPIVQDVTPTAAVSQVNASQGAADQQAALDAAASFSERSRQLDQLEAEVCTAWVLHINGVLAC